MLTPSTQTTLLRAISASGGHEVCGFLLCGPNEEQLFFRVANWSANPGEFVVADFEVERARRFAEKHCLTVAAFVHSHTSSLDLSCTDELGLKAGALPWIVVMERGGELFYRWYPPSASNSSAK